MLVCQALGLDMPGLVQVALHEALSAAEGGDGLADGGLVELGDLLQGARDLQASATATEGRLDGNGQAVLLGEGHHLIGSGNRIGRPGNLGCAGSLGDAKMWNDIVIGGALSANGMVSWKNELTPQQSEAIRLYVIKRANEDKALGN